VNKIELAVAFGKGFAVAAYLIFERWLGRTPKVEASNSIDLVAGAVKSVFKRVKGD
jgi:hypothetical protein